MRYVFDTFVIDAATRELIAAGTPLRVEPKVLDLLLYLIERRDRVVSKDELVDAVWQGRFISDAAISSTVAAARRALRISASSIASLMFGPITKASPQKHMAQPGSSCRPARKDRRASAWLKPQASRRPWSK